MRVTVQLGERIPFDARALWRAAFLNAKHEGLRKQGGVFVEGNLERLDERAATLAATKAQLVKVGLLRNRRLIVHDTG